MVLILYIESGSGSLTLARNIQHALKQNGTESKLYSLHDLLPKWLNHAIFGNYQSWCVENKTWFGSIFRSRWFYPLLYKVMPFIILLKNTFRRLESPNVFNQADAVICCSFFCGWFACYWQKSSGRQLPIYGVLGDYTVSPGWRLELDRLFIPMNFESPVFHAIRRKGGQITPSGIPATMNQVLKMGDKGCVMLSGGGWGLHLSTQSIEKLLAVPSLTHLIVLCGTNIALLDELNAHFLEQIGSGKLEVLGYTSEMCSLYARTEVVITKAGGLTLTEAALCNKPLIVSGFLPGHEEDNLHVFLRHNAVLYAENEEALVVAVHAVLTDSERAASLIQNAAALVNPQAGLLISHQIKKDMSYVDA